MILLCQSHTFEHFLSVIHLPATRDPCTITLLVPWQMRLLAMLFILAMLFFLETLFLLARLFSPQKPRNKLEPQKSKESSTEESKMNDLRDNESAIQIS